MIFILLSVFKSLDSQAIMLVCNDSFAGQSPKIFSCTLMIKDMEQMFAVVLSCWDEES